mgnify:CR=1
MSHTGVPCLEEFPDIRITGIDEKRPPRIRKEPYIDLFFRLSNKPPEEWCDEFNALAKDLVPPAKIEKSAGAFIDSYVRDMKHIPEHLARIKEKIIACNQQYIEGIRLRELASAGKHASLRPDEGEQRALNLIVATLNFDD